MSEHENDEVLQEEAVENKAIDGEENIEDDARVDQGPTKQFLTFNVGAEEYGIDLLKIREIKGWVDTTRLPNTPEFMKGVINLRGAVIPILDLKGRFDMGETQPTEKHVVIIVAVGDRFMGILVDSVSDIVGVGANSIKTAPQMESKLDDSFVSGLISLDKKMVVLLDVDNMFDPEHLKAASDVSPSDLD